MGLDESGDVKTSPPGQRVVRRSRQTPAMTSAESWFLDIDGPVPTWRESILTIELLGVVHTRVETNNQSEGPMLRAILEPLECMECKASGIPTFSTMRAPARE